MSLATKKWAKELSKGILNEFKKCLEEYVERLEKEAKEVVEMLEKTMDDKAKADPANKKMMKEELKDKKERVKIFKENTKKQMKDILNTLKLKPGNYQFNYKSIFQKEFENFQNNMGVVISGEGELPLIKDDQVKNIFIKFSPSDPIIKDPIIEDPFMEDFYDDESDIQGIQKMKRRFPDQNDPTSAVRTTHFMKLKNGQGRHEERAKRQKMLEDAAEQGFLFGGGRTTKGLQTKGLQTKGLKTKGRTFRNQQNKTRRYK